MTKNHKKQINKLEKNIIYIKKEEDEQVEETRVVLVRGVRLELV